MCSPSVLADVENSQHDDQQTPIIPIMPVEDDDTMIDASSNFSNQFDTAMATQPSEAIENTPGSALALGPDVMAAASAALSTISKCKEQGSMIDQDLLIKILSNPKLVENLVAGYGAGSVSSNTANSHPPPPSTFLVPSSGHEVNGVETPTPAVASNGHFYHQLNGTHVSPPGFPPGPPNQPGFGPSLARDANYYKNLIYQHGGERQEQPAQHLGHRYNHQSGCANQETMNNNNQRPRDSKPKIMKPCIYFNSSRGCRHGANCAYQHDAAAYQPRSQNNGNNNTPEPQNSKRMKFDRESGS